MKNKKVAGILALLFGIFGVHRFYLGQRFLGALYFFFFFFGIMMAIEEGVPIIIAPAILAFIDSILFFAMPQEDFDERYNKKRLQREYAPPRRNYRANTYGRAELPGNHFFKKRGIEKFREYDFEGAVQDFNKALENSFEDASIHFNLACCHSILEEKEEAFFHLEKTVAFGFNDFRKIHSHEALSYLRTLDEFDEFEANEYKSPAKLPSPEENLLDDTQAAAKADDLLEQIVKLGELRDSGILTDEEFALQKKKLLRE